jgi:hypothetical protein
MPTYSLEITMKHLVSLVAIALLATACGDSTTAPSASLSDDLDARAAFAGSDAASASASAAPARFVSTDEDFDCRGTVTGSFKNVFVRPGDSCTLTGAVVSGNILAQDRARLFVYETTTGGNIDGVEAAVLHVRGGRLEGSIQAQDGQSAGQTGIRIYGGTVLSQGNITIQKMNTGTIAITDAVLVKGNIQVQENTTGTALKLLRNRVAQNLEVFVNAGAGAKSVTGNTVSQKLSCKDNTGPFIGGPNSAGDVEGQCTR